MTKKNILNLALLLIVTLLISIINFSENENYELERLSTIDITSIKTITIQHNGNTTIINKPANAGWVIQQPVNIDVNKFRINSILKIINAPVHSRYSLQDIDLASIGLEKTTTSISLNEHVIDFGIINPITNLRYVKFENRIYTIEDVYYPLLNSHFGTLVSLKLLPTNSSISKLILINQTIARDDNNLWQSNITITADNIVKTLDHWQTMQAFGVHAYLERKQLGEVFIYTDNKQKPISYVITDRNPWLILARPEIDLEYHLDIEAYDLLITPR
ncbi:MAG: hypothetical protein COB77_06130 [Gammaproteobacteria bacterium]|nr:MAG: hypothetical protein COB77_06130 [Gammaproteobacteria bacterium]